jgi:LysR family transcriptional regulator, positive regulator for ilvC
MGPVYGDRHSSDKRKNRSGALQESQELALYLHLSRTLSFGRTSLECHVSPATLTRTVQRLEARAGARLLDRGRRGVALTADGQRFAAYAERALALWAGWRTDSADLAGELRIFATVTACQALLPGVLAPFRAAHPQVRLDLRTGDAGAALARLDEGEVDVAVAGLPERLPQSLVGRTLAVTDLVLVGGSSAGPFVVPNRGLVREAAERWFRSRGIRPVLAAEPDSHEGLLALVALGVGAGIVPRLVLETSAVEVEIVEEGLAAFPIGLCVRRADLRRPIVAALWGSVTAG